MGNTVFQVVAVYPSGNRRPVLAPHETRAAADWHRELCERDADPRDGWVYAVDEVAEEVVQVAAEISAEISAESYNGWSNYPTWCVNLWLANDEGLYREALALVADVLAGPHETPRLGVADALRAWVRDELAPDLGASFAADLLGYALDRVDWLEIADAWLEQVEEVV